MILRVGTSNTFVFGIFTIQILLARQNILKPLGPKLGFAGISSMLCEVA